MKRTLGLMLVVCVVATGFGGTMAAPAAHWFGLGGPMAMGFFPDMTGLNTFASENGLPAFGRFLIGGGGGGRGGVLGGTVFGGGGWGLVASTQKDDVEIEFVLGGGGFDIGWAVGGDENSILTLGAVLGGGGNVLTVSGYLVPTVEPEGLVPVPTRREIVYANGFVLPYVSLAAELLPWMGFELRIGYLLPVVGATFGDDLGIPAPSMKLAGPTVSFGLAFGGIGSAGSVEHGKSTVTAESEGTIVVPSRGELAIENALGDIVVVGVPVDGGQTDSERRVAWRAVRTAKEEDIDELLVLAEGTDAGASLTTEGFGTVDYVVQVPADTDLKIKNGTGNVEVTSHDAWTIVVENGIGDVQIDDVDAIALIVAVGFGELELTGVDARQLIAEVAFGEIDLALAPNTSAQVSAKTRLGDVDIARFPGMTGGVRGFLGQSGDVTLGLGEDSIELSVGIGQIGIEVRTP